MTSWTKQQQGPDEPRLIIEAGDGHRIVARMDVAGSVEEWTTAAMAPELMNAVETTHKYFLALASQDTVQDDPKAEVCSGVAIDELCRQAGELTGKAMEHRYGKFTVLAEDMEEIRVQAMLREANADLYHALLGLYASLLNPAEFTEQERQEIFEKAGASLQRAVQPLT